MNKKLESKNLILVNCDPEILAAAIRGDSALHELIAVKIPAEWSEFGAPAFQHALDKITENPSHQEWWTYFAVHKQDNCLVGSGGYAGRPDKSGVVEIGYEIAATYRGKGLATEFAAALIRNAFEKPEVNLVLAQTLAQENASTRVLQKCHMKKVAEVDDEENGKVWQWQLRKSDVNVISSSHEQTIHD